MSNDLLTEATRALRETEDVSEIEAHATRARVIAELHQTHVRRRTRLAFLLPVAATFLAASAWGAASGQARRAFQRVEQFIGLSASAPKTAHSTAALPPRLAAQDAVSIPPALPAAPLNAPPAAMPPSGPHAPPSGSAPSIADPALSLYRAAHNAHFVAHDPARALAAWDAYLAAAPHGAFAPEAQYNRALSLVRLGRADEARAALQPFASGAFGAYRQREANALLASLAR